MKCYPPPVTTTLYLTHGKPTKRGTYDMVHPPCDAPIIRRTYHMMRLSYGAPTMRCAYHAVRLPRGAPTMRCTYHAVHLPKGEPTIRCTYHTYGAPTICLDFIMFNGRYSLAVLNANLTQFLFIFSSAVRFR